MRNLKKVLALVLALVMSLSLVTIANAADFSDTADINYDEAVDVMVAAGIIDGVGNNSFDPNGTLTREQAAKLITYMLLGENSDKLGTESTSFKDVAATRWSAPAIEYCATLGIIDGTGDGNFYPAGKLTGYAFAKMLLTALGYDSQIEKFVGNSWTINVASIGMEVGLDDGLDKMFGSAELSRQEAAQMALNAIKAPLVYYPNKGNTVSVNGVVVDFTSQQYDYVTSTIAKEQTISDTTLSNSNQNTYTIELGEKYLPKLRLKHGTDDFARPADTWSYDGKTIGTYVNDDDLTYTASVKISDIYKDLGLSDTIPVDKVSVYVDGVEDSNQPARAIRKADTNNKYGANGVLTQVFYDADKETVLITEVNTYVGEVSRTVAATDKRDAYVVITTEAGTLKVPAKPTGVSGNLEYETNVSFEDEARVLYTYSLDTEEVKSLAVADTISGEATRADNSTTDLDENKGIVIDGTTYKFSKKTAGDSLGQVSVGNGYDLYLDEYDYVIYIEEVEEIGDYALMLAAQDKGDFSSNRALLIFADGTEKVVDTEKNYNPTDPTTPGSNTNKNAIYPGTIVTYRVDDGVYTLKPVKKTIATDVIASGKPTFGGTGTDDAFVMKGDKAGIIITADTADNDPYYEYTERKNAGSEAKSAPSLLNSGSTPALTLNANSSTVFVVYNVEEDTYTTYTGIKNVPDIKPTSTNYVNAYAYCKTGTMAKVMFIFVEKNVDIADSNQKLLFLAKESVSDLIHDKTGDYFEYNAIVGDQITTVKVDEAQGANKNGLFASYTTDKNGIITSLTPYAAAFNNSNAAGGDTKAALNDGVGIDKRSADYTVIMDTAGSSAQAGAHNSTVTVDEKATFFAVDEDGKITESSYRSVAKDDDDKVYAVVQDWLVKTLIIEEVNPSSAAETPAPVSIVPSVNDAAQAADTDFSAEVGDKVVLTADATVSKGTLSYQWYESTSDQNDPDDADSTRISGATKQTYTVPTGTTAAEKFYFCVVTNTDDTKDKTTDAASAAIGVTIGAKTNKMTVITKITVDGVEYPEYATATKTGTDGDSITIDAPVIEGKKPDAATKTVIFKTGSTVTVAFTYSDYAAKKIELADPTAYALVKYNTKLAMATEGVSDIDIKVTYEDDSTKTLKLTAANGFELSGVGTEFTDDAASTAKVQVAAKDTVKCDLPVKVYADVNQTVQIAGTTLGAWKATVSDEKILKGGSVTVTFEQKTAADMDQTAVEAVTVNDNTSTGGTVTVGAVTFVRAGANDGDTAKFTVEISITGAPSANELVIKLTSGD